MKKDNGDRRARRSGQTASGRHSRAGEAPAPAEEETYFGAYAGPDDPPETEAPQADVPAADADAGPDYAAAPPAEDPAGYEDEPAPAPAAPPRPRGARNGRETKPAGTEKSRKPTRPPKAKRKKSAGGVIAAVLCILLLVLLAGGVVALGLYVKNVDVIYPGVSVNGTYVGDMTQAEALALLSSQEEAAYKDYAVTVQLPLDYTLTVTAQDAGLQLSSEAAAQAAWNYGRGGGFFGDLIAYARCRWLNGAVNLSEASSRTLDDAAVRALVSGVAAEVNDALLKSEMKVGQYSVNIVKGAHALYIDEDTICSVLEDAILKADSTPIVYQVDMQTDEEMDLDSLYQQLTCDAVSATYDAAAGGATESQVGVTFDLAAAKKAWSAADYGDTVAIPLEITEPEVTTEQLNSMLFRDLLGEKTTSLSGSTANRISNVKKACELLSAVILQPGDEFDYNTTLGQRTEANGWLTAPAYADGEVREEYGGGICQVSSTLFNAVLLSNLKVTARTCHYFPVGYLPAGLDATVSWGGPEFRFVNTRDLPVRIKAFVSDDNRYVTVQLWGTNTDGSYVKINFSGAIELFNDNTLVDANGNPVATGYRASAWCDLINADGTIRQSDYCDFYSEYHYHTEDIMSKVATPSSDSGGDGGDSTEG